MTADEITKLLDELATRLEGPARYVFDLAVRQVWLEPLPDGDCCSSSIRSTQPLSGR